MKIRTNLSPEELSKISKGLSILADKSRNEIVLENPAEKELIRRVEAAFELAMNSLQTEVAKILLDKE